MFRNKALKKLSSPEQLDQLMQVTSPRRWIALATLAALLAAALAWGIWGEVDTDITGQGMLVRRGGVLSISALAGGRVLEYKIGVGDQVQAGQLVAIIDQPDISNQVRETQAELAGAQAQQDIFLNFGRKQFEIEVEYINKQIEDTRGKIERNRALIQNLTKRLNNQKELLAKGLVSEASLLDTMSNLISAESQLADNVSSLTQLDSTKEQKEKEFLQSRAQNEQDISTSLEKIQSLQLDLRKKRAVESKWSGRVLEIMFDLGEVINAGDALMNLEALGSPSAELLSLAYFSANKGKRVRVGMKARVSPRSVEADEYGFIEGEVIQVADFPSTRQGMLRSLHNQSIVDDLIQAGATFEVWVKLHKDETTVSGFKWTSAGGPPFKISSGIMCDTLVTVEARPPIMLVLPMFRKYFLGVQDKLEFSR